MDWKELKEHLIETFRPNEVERMEKAYQFAEQYHRGQKRLSGDPYITHTLATAENLFELHCDADTLIAGLLHDCIEDTEATYEMLVKEFGKEVADLVDGVTKISTRVFRDSEERKAENLRKIMLAMVKDIRVIVIKLADRLHNMRTLEHLAREKQIRLARETNEIYAPLAHRLGMGRVKNELEDLSFKYLHPREYAELRYKLAAFEEQRHQTIEQVNTELKELLKESKIKATVQGRMKHKLSIWNKMRFQDKDLDQIYDIMALRVVTKGLKECYTVLGIVHARWKPLPRRFKDFIAMPKSNMYQSIHTTIISPSGEPLEIQIRTEEMHRTAEEGIAAHWSYKEGDRADKQYETKLAWFRQFLDWQQDLRDSREFMEALKIDLFEDEVFVFTPKGEVKSLRRGSTPIDFAYLIHSGLGDKIIGAKVNNRLVPLKHEMKNGDIIEIITRSDARPSRDWLKIVKTTKAKNRIRHYFRQQEREDNIEKGRGILDAELQRCETSLNEVLKKDRLLDAAGKMNFKEIDELFIQLGDGNLSAKTVSAKLGFNHPQVQPPVPMPATTLKAGKKTDKGIKVHGLSGMVVRFAQCCHPIPGDPIIGFITQGRGVSIHRQDCVNMRQIDNDPGRKVDVTWGEMQDAVHTIRVFVLAQDRERLLADILQVLYDTNAILKGTETRTTDNNLVEGTFMLEIKSQEHLKEIFNALQKVKGVLRVNRK